MNTRRIVVYRGSHRFDNTRQLYYECGNTGKLSNMRLVSICQYYDNGESFSGTTIPGMSLTTKKMIDGIVIFISQSSSNGNRYIFEGIVTNVPECDNEKCYFPNETIPCRVEVYNENDVLVCENGKPFYDGTYPPYSPYYPGWIANRWKDKPTLSLDTTNTNHNQISMKGSATYGNEALGFALFGVSGDDETFIETVDGATSFEFTTLEEVDAGDYSFRIYPFKAPPAEGEDPELGTPSDLLTVTVSDTDPTAVKT